MVKIKRKEDKDRQEKYRMSQHVREKKKIETNGKYYMGDNR